MHKNVTKCNKTQSKWCINKHGASKIIDTLETYQRLRRPLLLHNPKSSSLASILAAVAAATGSDGGAYPFETAVGRRGVSRQWLTGAGGQRRRALGCVRLFLARAWAPSPDRWWGGDGAPPARWFPRSPQSDLGLGPRSQSGGPRRVWSWWWPLPCRRAALVCPLHVFRSGW
jgi:hypothetical protein